jgi:hypothetical protein
MNQLGELNDAERIRELNIHRLSKLQEQQKNQMALPGERGDEFANLREKQFLKEYDKDLFNMLTPNPTHNKSVGLISTGANILSSYKKKQDNELHQLEDTYLNPIRNRNFI